MKRTKFKIKNYHLASQRYQPKEKDISSQQEDCNNKLVQNTNTRKMKIENKMHMSEKKRSSNLREK